MAVSGPPVVENLFPLFIKQNKCQTVSRQTHKSIKINVLLILRDSRWLLLGVWKGLACTKESKNLDPVTGFLTDTGTNVWRAIELKLE
jgi:hypothetical protein